MAIEVVDWVFEERVKRYLVKWMGGENLTTAARVITEMAKEAADTSYE
jgi:cell division GTPase FtsZ